MGRKGTGKKTSRKRAKSKPSNVKPADSSTSNGSKSAQTDAQTSAQSQPKSGKLSPQQKAAASSANKARLVITHSTYIPGLIKLLEKLACCPEIQTITPAAISRVNSNSPRLRLKVSVPIQGGHKLIARQRKSAQEVFVITQWSKAELEQAIAQILPKPKQR